MSKRRGTSLKAVDDTGLIKAGHQKYRPDVDGLRAVSVALVVAYHAFGGKFHGGYIGVDVFFVISGYLISSIIFSEIQDRKFRFSRFYARRIKRIFPALIPVLTACLAIGACVMMTNEYRDLGNRGRSGARYDEI